MCIVFIYKGHSQSSWIHLITPSQKLCGDAVMVPFLKYLPWQVMHFLQHSTHFSEA